MLAVSPVEPPCKTPPPQKRKAETTSYTSAKKLTKKIRMSPLQVQKAALHAEMTRIIALGSTIGKAGILQLLTEKYRGFNAGRGPCRLPRDVLSKIFTFYVDATRGLPRKVNSPPMEYSWMAVSQVCHLWRIAALKTPAIWTNISIPPANDILVNEQLDRSEDASLRIEIALSPKTITSWVAILCARWRWREMTLDLTLCPPITSPLAGWKHCGVQVLTLRSRQMQPLPIVMDMQEGDIAHLHTLSIMNLRVPCTHPMFRSSLTTLKITCSTYGHLSTTPLEDMISELGRMPNLEHLSIEKLIGIPEDLLGQTVAELSRLSTFYILDTPTGIIGLLDHMTFPSTTVVRLMLDLSELCDEEPSKLGQAIVSRLNVIRSQQEPEAGPVCFPSAQLQQFNASISDITISLHAYAVPSSLYPFSLQIPIFTIGIQGTRPVLRETGQSGGFADFITQFPLSSIRTFQMSVPLWKDGSAMVWIPMLQRMDKLDKLIVFGTECVGSFPGILSCWKMNSPSYQIEGHEDIHPFQGLRKLQFMQATVTTSTLESLESAFRSLQYYPLRMKRFILEGCEFEDENYAGLVPAIEAIKEACGVDEHDIRTREGYNLYVFTFNTP
ncbi:unnamed protein product [Somion occarium]|uniref:F-box domain-containing protein n=1 Tax=Somion occarium TaxID=3059160 RepID=A0ABP1DW48_9APHY